MKLNFAFGVFFNSLIQNFKLIKSKDFNLIFLLLAISNVKMLIENRVCESSQYSRVDNNTAFPDI